MSKSNKKIGFLTAFLSIMAAAIGVQKRENMERDLNAINPIVYVFAAILFLIIFIGSIILVVNLVVPKQ